ncbi:MAG: PIG-L family deacetylase [Proteobacteria bacterium]|nr:PIG-L family deacetylase [Pseudomonadota bacterium]
MSDIVLIIAAHPDDEILGCGGTIARLAQEGHAIYIAILGEGLTSRYERREQVDRSLFAVLHKRCRLAADLMGATDLFLYDLPDNKFDTVPLLEVVKIVEALIKRLKPQVIYTHYGGDLNIDHGIAFRAVMTAARPLPGSSVREVYTFETPSATEWGFQKFGPVFAPNVFVDISATLGKKLKAMQLYESEIREFPHPRSLDALRAIARRWGSVAGLEAAEAFELVRAVR